MTDKRCLIFLFLVAQVSAADTRQLYSPFATDVVTEPSSKLTEHSTQDQQLDLINDEFNRLHTFLFTHGVQATQPDIQCQKLLLLWQKITTICSRLCAKKTGDRGKQCLLSRELYIDYLKRAYLKLHLITLDTADGAVEQQVSKDAFDAMMLSVCAQLMTWLKSRVTDERTTDLLDNNRLTEIVRAAIPADIIGTQPYRLLRVTPGAVHAATLYNVLGIDLYDISSVIAQAYLDLMIAYGQNRYTQDHDEQDRLIAQADMLVYLVYEKMEEQETSVDTQIVLNAYMNNIWHIKQKLSFAQQLEQCALQNPEAFPSFIKHHRIVQSSFFMQMYTHLCSVDRGIVDAYCILMDHFFADNGIKESSAFMYDLEKTIVDLQRIKAQYSGGWLKKLWHGSMPSADIIADMMSVLECIKNPQAGNQVGYGPLIQDIISGDWLGGIKKIIKTDSGEYVLECANQLLGKKQFGDIKSAALYALIYASPFLLTRVIKYVLPYLSGEIKDKATALLGYDKKHGDTGEHDLVEFANKNPELIKNMCDRNPEIIDLLAQSLKQHAVAEKP